MADRKSFSGQHRGLTAITAHHQDLVSSLTLYFSVISPYYSSRFAQYTVAEVTDELRERLDEVDRASSLDVLSSVEATFRIDYLQRCQRRLKDPISVSLRKIYRFKKNRASLEDEIFDAWIQNSPGLTRLFSELRGAFKYRHWLAHGRYWTPKLGRRFDFPYIYELAEATFTNLQFEL